MLEESDSHLTRNFAKVGSELRGLGTNPPFLPASEVKLPLVCSSSEQVEKQNFVRPLVDVNCNFLSLQIEI